MTVLRRLKRGTPKGTTTDLTEIRVEAIAATLRNCTFKNGVTLQAFAADWGIELQRVHELSAIASKRVRAEVTDPDRVAAKGFAMLEKIADEAMTSCDAKTGDTAAHRALAVKATAEWIKLSGVAAPTKQQVAVTGDLTALTDEQLEARAAALVAKLRAEGKK